MTQKSTDKPQRGQPQSSAARGTGRGRSTSAPSRLSSLDYPLIAVIATFLALGLFTVYSASAPRSGAHFFTQQLKWVVVGVAACAVMTVIPSRWWQKLALPLMAVCLALLVAVLVVGNGQFGAQRTLFGGRLQPSELAKLAVAIYVAAWVSARGTKLERFNEGLVPFIIIMGLVGGLIALERSFSVTIIVLTIGLMIFFVGGGNIGQVLLVAGIAIPILLFFMWQSEYPFDRINQWINVMFRPEQARPDLLRIFQMLKSGQGIGTDVATWHSKAAVPGLWSDYLFANIGADLHFPGTFAVVALYAYFGYRGLGIALNAHNRFAALVAVGITVWVLVQAAIHIGTSLALIPVTGQPLPFMSYGGSSLVSCMAAAGLLLSIARDSIEKKTVYAHFAFRGGDRRPRVSDPGSRGSSGHTAKERARKRSSAGSRIRRRLTGGAARDRSRAPAKTGIGRR